MQAELDLVNKSIDEKRDAKLALSQERQKKKAVIAARRAKKGVAPAKAGRGEDDDGEGAEASEL